MAEGDYQPEPYRPTFPLDFNSQHYECQMEKYQKPSQSDYQVSPYKGAPGGADSIDTFLKADRYTTGQRVESIIAMIGMRCLLKKKIQGELQHLRSGLQNRINQTMYFGDRLPTMVERRSDLEKQLLQLDTEGVREEQTFWKAVAMLSKELRDWGQVYSGCCPNNSCIYTTLMV
jgi:hypothetical protein